MFVYVYCLNLYFSKAVFQIKFKTFRFNLRFKCILSLWSRGLYMPGLDFGECNLKKKRQI